ncbi:hypothetical protein SRB17_73880 [Streptomyces sp. RB17]|uniref:hypothetical protein n=1 Tax=Streptomyces sp. RB17 TaxID=2585197 RepID=UPI001297E5D5|nr:hypothetical protein [Streptomyces sp. RB17]MQY39366.1 hypothetical protein [Streptomyces sp. RB17]
MFDGLHDFDWASMDHAYGTAQEVPALLTALRSPDAENRGKALDRFYGAVHHQGGVYPSTAPGLPFPFELTADDATPDRAAVLVRLDRMGPLAAPAPPLLRERLARPRRGGRFQSVEHDEELQRLGRTLIARLDPPAPEAPAPRRA